MVEKDKLGIVIFGFVLIILGIIFLDVIADQIASSTSLTIQTDETITITADDNSVINETFISSGNSNKTDNTVLNNITFFGNATNNTDSNLFNVSLHVNFTREGNITLDITKFPAATPYNISYTFENNTVGTTDNADVTEITFFGNGTVNSTVTGITIGTQINVTKATGVVTLASFNFSAANYRIDYVYEGVNYVNDTSSRVILNLIPIFFVIGGVFLVAIGFSLDMGLRDFMNSKR